MLPMRQMETRLPLPYFPLTQGKCVLRSDSNAVKATDKNPFFALRPEDIHLKTDSNAHENTFKAKLVESTYLGQYVKAKAQAGNLSLNVTLDVLNLEI